MPLGSGGVDEAVGSAVESAAAQEIAAGYATEGAALELGTVLIDGQVDPTARVRIPLSMLNRHGLVAGATGTGKTKTLQGIAEQLSSAGVAVLLADIKGDVSGMSRPGEPNAKIDARAADTGDDWTPTAYPVEFLSLAIERNLPLATLLQTDFLVASDAVASYYGLGERSDSGLAFAPIEHENANLGGLLTQAAILAGLSDGREANPVKRGAWLARKIIAEPPDDPPPNVPKLPDDVQETMQRAALTAFHALSLRDYARVDFRLTRDGKVYLIEANPNPYLSSGAEFIKGARASGRTYGQTILEIVELARARYAATPAVR